ncbi:MAG: translation elongation factor Ts [Gammaproteobacteria bacterium TMED222]|jgi:elongation factor Ts|nr:translation elongation factor Ts [SAR86 cluster bacterium]OUW81765.1 MAG: translation elongation factor Ts [Gammaproteobacteria bacterium TMED222]|tara:strand:- start:20787 stop:21641 length:855 start_codon:yes stop_codon:yes gene_type:complete
MSISASDVKNLREKTGLGMMECKKALEEAKGDAELAITNLRKNSALKAEKKSSRTAVEGVILSSTENSKNSILVEINCETDFVAKDESFLKFTEEVMETCINSSGESLESLLSSSLEEKRQNLVQKIGENIVIRRKFNISASFVYSYIHGNKKIGVLLSLEKDNEDLGKDLAMHIAASSPLAINSEDISKDVVEKEKEIIEAQVSDSDKPQEIIEKMISGRLNKFLSEVSLVDQPFVKDPSIKISELLKNNDNSVLDFIRYEVGEGIEVEKKDFAEEVQAQLDS